MDLSPPKDLVDERTKATTHTVAQGYLPTDKGPIRCAVSTDLGKERLVVFATTVPEKEEPDILCIARWYLSRWNAQENVFRYLVEFVDLDINFGINKKTAVVNRQMHRKVEKIEGRVAAQKRTLQNKHKQLQTLHEKIERVKGRQAIGMAKLEGKRLHHRGTATRQEKQQRYSERLSKYAVQEAMLVQKIDEHQQTIARWESKRSSLNEEAPLYEIDTEKDLCPRTRVSDHDPSESGVSQQCIICT